ncbi:MAG: efflux transporter periplasmic adaptor subunit [Chitinophagaceae bacterium]|nr:efflux transporter periplasmic adaptor subunit [Chitinophagaceae bacterium]
MKSIKTTVLVLVIIGALVFIKLKFFENRTDASKIKNTKGGSVPSSAVNVFIAKKQTFNEQIISTGTALANEDASLMPEVAGKVVKIYFSEGTFVKKNTLLVKINDADLRAQLDKIELQIKLSDQMAKRQKDLLEINGVSQEAYDIALNQANGYKSDRDLLHAQLQKTEIRAPFDGVVGLKSISEGSYVTPSSVVATIQQLTPMKIDFSVPEKYMDLVKKGDPLTFSAEGIKGAFKANVFAIEPKIDLATRTLKIRALCFDHQNKLLPGAFVKVEMTKESSNSILIPTEGLIPEQKGYKVFFYHNGKAMSGKVEPGTRTDSRIVITSGITEGDTIITTGLMQMKNEAPVKIIGSVKQ